MESFEWSVIKKESRQAIGIFTEREIKAGLHSYWISLFCLVRWFFIRIGWRVARGFSRIWTVSQEMDLDDDFFRTVVFTGSDMGRYDQGLSGHGLLPTRLFSQDLDLCLFTVFLDGSTASRDMDHTPCS